MCDEDTVRDAEFYLKQRSGLTRRQFNGLAAGAATLAVLSPVANAMAVVEHDVEITTPDGVADCYFVHPAEGAHAAVLMWPDIVGLRPGFRAMGKRLAESGYAVLVINPYYRDAKAPVVPEGASFQDPAIREIVIPYYRNLSPQTHFTDAEAFVAWLDEQPAVDTSRRVGSAGYCMGGPMVMRTAAAWPDRVGAGAVFHGSRVVAEGDESPHLLIPEMNAGFLFAIAENDDERSPEDKTVLREAFDAAGLDAEIEVYPGTQHGWCAIDSRVHNPEQADRAWGRMLALFEANLA